MIVTGNRRELVLANKDVEDVGKSAHHAKCYMCCDPCNDCNTCLLYAYYLSANVFWTN